MFLFYLFKLSCCIDTYRYIEAEDNKYYDERIHFNEHFVLHLRDGMIFYLVKEDDVEIAYTPNGKLQQGPFINKNIIVGCLYRDRDANVTITSRKQKDEYSKPQISTIDVLPNCTNSCLEDTVFGNFDYLDDGLLYYDLSSISLATKISMYAGVIGSLLYILIFVAAWCCC